MLTKSLFKSLFATLFVLLFYSETNAQIKIFSNENVQVGPYWGGTPSNNLFVNGSGHFNCHPAQWGGFYIQNYSFTSSGINYNDPIILPNVSHNLWLGNSNTKLYQVWSHSIHYGPGGINQYSDIRLKTNIEELTSFDAITKVKSIKTYRFDYTEEAFPNVPEERMPTILESGKNQIGVMAQELSDVYPEAVTYDEVVELYSVDYVKMIPLLIEAIKEQQAKIEELQAIVDAE